MARDKKPVNWGQPGQTGVTKDGVPWYVPENGPTKRDRFMQKVFRLQGTYMPVWAKPIPARTAAEVRERCLLGYRDKVAPYLDEGEEIAGFVEFALGQRVPQPPGRLAQKVGPPPLRHWWMGGDWDSMAGRLIIAVGGSKDNPLDIPGDRHLLWVRTDRRVVIMDGPMDKPPPIYASFGLDQVGVRPGKYLGDPAKGLGTRVDIAFADGSWLGLEGYSLNVPGSTKDNAERLLLAELAGPPVVSDVLPARGLG